MATYAVNPAGGGDFVTLQAAMDAHGGGHTYECYTGNIGRYSQTGSIASQINVWAAAGHECDPDEGWAGRTYMYSYGHWAVYCPNVAMNMYFRGISMRGNRTYNEGDVIYHRCGTWLFEKCMIEYAGTYSGNGAVWARGGLTSSTFRNCWIKTTQMGFDIDDADVTIENCTIRGSATNVGVEAAAGAKVYNTIILNFTSGLTNTGNFAVLHNCIDSTATVNTVACTDRADNQASVDEDDVCVDPTNWDLSPKPGGLADGAGENLTAIFTDDFYGNPRPATGAWTAGAIQLAAGGPFPHYTRRRMQGGMIPMGIG